MSEAASPKSALVVGAGVVGIGCAHYLSKAGLDVTVIDRGSIAGACSAGNCGYVSPSHVFPLTEPAALPLAVKSLLNPRAPFRVKPTLDPTLIHWMLQFARRCTRQQMVRAGHSLHALLESSRDLYSQLMAEEQLACEWDEKGLLFVFRSPRQLDAAIAHEHFAKEQFGVDAKVLSAEELLALEPALKPGLAGGLHHTADASLRPDRLCSEWAERLKSRGVRFMESCELESIGKREGAISHLETSSGSLEADVIVIAVGAWSPHWASELECRLPVQPGKGYSVTMDRPDPCPQYPMLFPEHRVGVSPFETGYRLGSMMEFAGFDETIPEHRIQQLRDAAEPYLIAPHTEHVQGKWYGWRPMTWDSVPIIGPVPKLRNAYLATGHNMLGVSMATGTGKLVAEMALGEAPHLDLAGYSPTRF